MSDLTALALAAAAGDRSALTAFVRDSQSDVWSLCRHLGGLDDADDLTQEVYVRAIRGLGAYRAEASARTWLLAIAQRTCADHVRRAQRRRLLLGRLRTRPVAPHEPSPSGAVDLDLLVGALGTDRRGAFVLTQILGLGYDEAAAVLGVPVGTIRSRVARARAELVTKWDATASG